MDNMLYSLLSSSFHKREFLRMVANDHLFPEERAPGIEGCSKGPDGLHSWSIIHDVMTAKIDGVDYPFAARDVGTCSLCGMKYEEEHSFLEYWDKYRLERGFLDPREIQSLRMILGISVSGFEKLFGLMKGQLQFIEYGYPLTLDENTAIVGAMRDPVILNERFRTVINQLGSRDRWALSRKLSFEGMLQMIVELKNEADSQEKTGAQ
jgi:hypothetical protein